MNSAASPKCGTSFAEIVDLFDAVVGGANADIGFHGAFWRGVTRDQFVALPPYHGVVPVVVGDSKASGIVEALRGTGSFDPATGAIERMPPYGPYMSAEDIATIADWIDGGCPE